MTTRSVSSFALYEPSPTKQPPFVTLADQYRASKRLRIDGIEDDYEMDDISTSVMEEYSFDDICSDANFSGEEGVDAKTEIQSWNRLDGHLLARVFHFLRADMKSLASVGQTCRHWRSTLNCYRNVSRQVDLSSIALGCNDAIMLSILVKFISIPFPIMLTLLISTLGFHIPLICILVDLRE